MNLYRDDEQVEAAAHFLQPSWARLQPNLAILLGSGMMALPEVLTEVTSLPYSAIPHFPISTVPGHTNQWLVGKLFGTPVVVLVGRIHLYEGFSPAQVAFAVRVLAKLSIKTLWMTNASGAISPGLQVGDVVVIRDHINWLQSNPLVGPVFVDLQQAYSPSWRQRCQHSAKQLGIKLKEGVYTATLGPSYETPAEIQMLLRAGADVVGMSTINEVIQAAALRLETLVLSVVTNQAAGLSATPLSHEEVSRNAKQAYRTMLQLWQQLLQHPD